MRRVLPYVILLAAAVLPSAPVYAEETPPWKGSLEFSYLQTSGNTDSQTMSAAGKAERSYTRWKVTGEFKAIYGEKNNVASDKNWSGRLRFDRRLTDRTTVFILEGVERDTLKGMEFRYLHQGGISHDLIKTPKDILQAALSGGYIHEDRVDPFKDRGYPAARLFGGYTHHFTEKSRFEQTVEYIPNLKKGQDYLINEETALVTNLMGNFALKASFAVTYDNLPPPDFQKSDRVFKTALIYTF